MVRAQGDVRVTTLAREDHVVVSLELPGAYTEEIRDAVASGLETTFGFDIELRQPVAFWLDRTVDQRVGVGQRAVRWTELAGIASGASWMGGSNRCRLWGRKPRCVSC